MNGNRKSCLLKIKEKDGALKAKVCYCYSSLLFHIEETIGV